MDENKARVMVQLLAREVVAAYLYGNGLEDDAVKAVLMSPVVLENIRVTDDLGIEAYDLRQRSWESGPRWLRHLAADVLAGIDGPKPGDRVGSNANATGYDPVAAGKADAEAEKRPRDHADLAWR